MKLHYLFFAISFVLLSGCGGTFNGTWMEYEETKCANPWENGTNTGDNKDNVKTFLELNNVDTYGISFNENGTAEDCEACTCKNGRIVCANVNNDDVKTAEALGFKEH